MNKIIIACLFLSVSANLCAQDTIHLRRSKKVAAKVVEVGPKVVSFHKSNEPGAAIYKVDINYIDSIIYQSGRVDRFIQSRKPTPPGGAHRAYRVAKNSRSFASGPNSFSSGIFLLDNTNRTDGSAYDINNKAIVAFYTSYEKMIAGNKLGFSITPFVGANRKAFGAAAGVTLYPRPYSTAVFHMGPQFFLYRSEIYHSRFNQEGGYSISGIYPTTILTFIYNVGVNFHINKNWMIATDLGLGKGLINTKRRELDKLRGYGDRHGYIFNDIMVNAKLGVAYRF